MTASLAFFFFFSSRRRHTRYWRDWSSDVCSSDLEEDRQERHVEQSRGAQARKKAADRIEIADRLHALRLLGALERHRGHQIEDPVREQLVEAGADARQHP